MYLSRPKKRKVVVEMGGLLGSQDKSSGRGSLKKRDKKVVLEEGSQGLGSGKMVALEEGSQGSGSGMMAALEEDSQGLNWQKDNLYCRNM